MIKLSELLSMDAPINSKLRIHVSSTAILTLEPKDASYGQPTSKPSGLWYGFGRSWLDFWKDYRGISSLPDCFIYHVKIKQLDRVFLINDSQKMEYFTMEYSDSKAHRWGSQIDWKKVSQDYAGIEINPLSVRAYIYRNPSITWYNGWDISSGCIWDTSIVELNQIYPKLTPDMKDLYVSMK